MNFRLRSKFGIEIGINVVLPWLVYIQAQPAMGRVHALMLSSLPPIAWSVVQIIRKRRVDALSIFVVAGIGLSLVAFLGGGSYRVLELREHLVTGLIGLVFLGSVAIRRPLAVVLLQSMVEREPRAEDAKLVSLLNDRRRMTRMTIIVGFLLLIQTSVAVSLIFALPVREFLIVGPIASYVLLGLIVAAVFLYKKHRDRMSSAQAENSKSESNL